MKNPIFRVFTKNQYVGGVLPKMGRGLNSLQICSVHPFQQNFQKGGRDLGKKEGVLFLRVGGWVGGGLYPNAYYFHGRD